MQAVIVDPNMAMGLKLIFQYLLSHAAESEQILGYMFRHTSVPNASSYVLAGFHWD